MKRPKVTYCVLLALLLGLFYNASAADIWVAKNGSDANKGTKQSPLATVHMALRKARELRRLQDPSIAGGIQIIVEDGVYKFFEPLLIRPEDAGTATSPTTIKAAPNAQPVFSGGVTVKNWRKAPDEIQGFPAEATGKLWVAEVPLEGGQMVEFRQLWINGQKAKRATNLDEGELDRILSVDSARQEMWIPTPKWDFKNLDQLEFVIHQWWAIANLRVKSVEVLGEKTKLTFHQPESQIEFQHPWPAPFIDEKKEYNGNSAYYWQGAAELLNQPGEWYLDKKGDKVYYWPKAGENMQEAEAIVPFLETIVQVEGNADHLVEHVEFVGIGFEHTTWMRPSHRGHVPLQAGWYILEAYKLKQPGTPDKASLENQAWTGRQPAGVAVNYAKKIRFERCRFEHMAATGLDFVEGVSNSEIIGNVFKDLGGTGIQAGYFGGPDFESHLPYNPIDQRELVHHLTIANNYITNVTNEDWGTVGISVGSAHDVNIEHNEVSDINYSGICVGWFWTKTITSAKNNRIHANRIHHFAKQMYDVGGIYTLSAQPNTVISENAIYDLQDAPYAHMPHHHQYIYFDEGSSYIRAIDNWTEKDKFFSNSPGPGNLWENNGPKVDLSIRKKAGLEEDYQNIKE
ncbi:right-handed parallel beta-helix repeat-containing protein [Echinicola sp. CAU 1574]|uniref:Right-handed parallel beta-helix repeat-containing protein n=1 Tax=Echinicola arenosa TaxID=2774144 RepID=A0ABR9ALW5_9BACT|nr:right-handed parallel beta-helix repeat-containing protein [Echinicola arenosa]MBD8489793.1 right-handed parallel beta-helix repeat-containing protein [Echinicola arenosa]